MQYPNVILMIKILCKYLHPKPPRVYRYMDSNPKQNIKEVLRHPTDLENALEDCQVNL